MCLNVVEGMGDWGKLCEREELSLHVFSYFSCCTSVPLRCQDLEDDSPMYCCNPADWMQYDSVPSQCLRGDATSYTDPISDSRCQGADCPKMTQRISSGTFVNAVRWCRESKCMLGTSGT